ncbi:MAG: efflux RND transporter periplasmic adaptor subunit [Chloroflexi bacterium]|nr:efflux RND transporter periplasmic adaptor subunit [Chloroflexota bacterium]
MTTPKENPVELSPSEPQTMPRTNIDFRSQQGFVGTSILKLGVFLAITTVIAIGAYFGAQVFLLDDDTVDDNRRPVAVKRGTLLDDVTASGSVTFPELESLRFDISGTIAELLVEEGESVFEGQLLILLDDVTIAALESSVANAEIALQDASENLADLLNGASSLEIAVAESNLADARVNSINAGEDLTDLINGASSLEIAVAESNLADARVNSMDARSALAEYTTGSNTDSPALIKAKDKLSDANQALTDALLTADDNAEAQDELVAAAQEVLEETVKDYSAQISGWFGSVTTELDRVLEPDILFGNWGTTVDKIFSESTVTVDSPPDDLETPWNESIVWVWTHLTPYPILTNCETTSLTARCPSTEIDDAWDVKVAAEEALAETVDDAFTAAKSQQILVDTAQEAVESAADEVIDTVNEIDIDALAASLAEKIELEKDAEAAVEDLTISVNHIDIDALAARLVEKIELEKDAETTLAELGVLDALQIKLATAAINQASANLDNARTELAAANLSAPFSGIISSISVAPGDQVSRSTPTIDILDPSVITVDGTVDEIDVLSLRLGNQVAVTLDALPDQVLAGVIDEIGDGVNQQGIVEFPLTIALTPPDSVELIEGLSATATIVLNQIDNALLVPLQAIGGSFTQPTVDVVTESGFITTEVTLGASDDFWVVIESGLTEGQEVLMTIAESVDPLEQLFGGGAIRIPGGAGGATFTGQQRGGGGGGGR